MILICSRASTAFVALFDDQRKLRGCGEKPPGRGYCVVENIHSFDWRIALARSLDRLHEFGRIGDKRVVSYGESSAQSLFDK